MGVSGTDARARLAELEERIEALKQGAVEKPHQEEHYSLAQQAWRMVVELVAGIAIGFGMGYGLDIVFGTNPFFLVIFTLLGFAAGVKTMMNTAAELNPQEAVVPDGAEETAGLQSRSADAGEMNGMEALNDGK